MESMPENIKFEAVKKISEMGFRVRDLSKISKVDSKLTGHFGWHKGKDEELKRL